MPNPKDKIYVGINNDNFGMSPTGNIIRDAWVFGLLPEDQTCEGWSYDRIDALYDKVWEAWKPFGNMASRLPDDLRQRHARIYEDAISHARALGWDPGVEEEE